MHTLPQVPGLDLAAQTLRAHANPRDFLFTIQRSTPHDDLLIALGDLSFTPINAAVHDHLRRQFETLSRTHTTTDQILARLNDDLLGILHPTQFVTAILLRIDPTRGTLHYTNAGHEPFLHRTPADTALHRAPGPALGVLPRSSQLYHERFVPFQSGDALCLYTDGLTEALNPHHEFFEHEGAQRTLQHTPPSAKHLVDWVLGSLREFCADQPRTDDLTILALHKS